MVQDRTSFYDEIVFQVNREKELLKSQIFPRIRLLKIQNDFMLNLLFSDSNKLAQEVHEVISQCIMDIIVDLKKFNWKSWKYIENY